MSFNPLMVSQIRLSIILILSFSLMGSSILVPNSSAQENVQIPEWVKNVAGWWANGEVSETEFLTGISYLINNNIIRLDFMPCSIKNESQTISSAKLIPDWVKNNAKWWYEELIEDAVFVNGITHMIQHQIIGIDNGKILGVVPLEDVTFSHHWNIDKKHLVYVTSSFFEVYGKYGDCIVGKDGYLWRSLSLGLNPNKMDMYNEVALWNDPQRTVVVFPYFTAMAYNEPGFYNYYSGECDDCTTVKFTNPTVLYTSSGIGHQALSLLGYHSITDIDIDKNPAILQEFDNVIMLHK